MTDLNALYLRRNDLWNSQPTVNLAASPEKKAAYKLAESIWLAAMHDIDRCIAGAKKGEVV